MLISVSGEDSHMTGPYTPGESSDGTVSSLEESLGLAKEAQKLSRTHLRLTDNG